jgi:hypothetical protein
MKVLADIAKWSDHLRPIQIAEFTGPKPGPTTVMENNKRELDFFNLNKGKMKRKLFFYWPVLKESWIPPFM